MRKITEMLRAIVCMGGGIISAIYSLKYTFVYFLCFIKINVCQFIMRINDYLQNKKVFSAYVILLDFPIGHLQHHPEHDIIISWITFYRDQQLAWSFSSSFLKRPLVNYRLHYMSQLEKWPDGSVWFSQQNTELGGRDQIPSVHLSICAILGN